MTGAARSGRRGNRREEHAAVWYRGRVELRNGWRAVAFLTVLVALVAGGVLGVVVGVRRNATAYDRLVQWSGGPDVVVTPGESEEGFGSPEMVRRIRALPTVKDVSVLGGLAAVPVDRTDRPNDADWTFQALVPTDAKTLHTTMRPILLAGRLPDPAHPTEIIVNERTAHDRRLWVGSSFRFAYWSETTAPAGNRITARVVGIVRFSDEIVQAQNAAENVIVLSPAFFRRHPEHIAFRVVNVNLVDSSRDIAEFEKSMTALATVGPPGFATVPTHLSLIHRVAGPTNSTMIMFALVFGLIGLLVIGESIRKVHQDRSRARRILGALGAGPGRLYRIALVVPLAGVTLGLIGAAAVSVALSPLFPIGIASRAELHRGVAINVGWTLAGLAIAAIVIVTVVEAVTWQSVTRSRSDRLITRSSRLVGWMRQAGMPLAAVLGTRHALTPSTGSRSARSGIGGLTLGVAALVLAVVFAANLTSLERNPHRYGWNWDQLVELNGKPGSPQMTAVLDRLEADPAVAAVSGLTPMPLVVNGTRMPAVAVVERHRPIEATMVEGRPPTGKAEVALGARAMRQLGVHLHDRVALSLPGTSRVIRATVVGQVVLPTLGVELQTDNTGLGFGVLAPLATIERLGHRKEVGITIRYRPNASASARAASIAPFRKDLTTGNAVLISGAQKPNDIVGLEGVGRLPLALSLVLTLLVTLGLGLAMKSSLQSRRRDLAVLKGIGFLRRQLVGIVMWEATVASLIAVTFGVTLGVAAGRWTWRITARELGIAPTTITPLPTLGLLAIGALVVGNLVALIPARIAARTPVNSTLKSE